MSAAPIMNPNLRDFWETKSDIKVLYGGRDSTKSTDAAIHSIRLTSNIKLKFLCTRMYQNRIDDSVYTLIKEEIERFGFLNEYEIYNNKIVHRFTGSNYLFYGLSRNIKEIKSIQGIDILWIEEAHFLTKEMWDVLEPTLRKEHSEIWIIFNPDLITDFVYHKFIVNTPPNCITRLINYTENPFLSEKSKRTIEQRKKEDYDSYLHIYMGMPRQDDEDVFIKRSWLQSCIDAHKKLNIEITGEKVTGYDVADGGRDLNAYINKHGILITKAHQWKAKEDELFNSSQKVRDEAIHFGSRVVYDSVGLGAGTGSNIKRLNSLDAFNVNYESFNSGGAVVNKEEEYQEKVLNKDYFKNIKAQAWKIVGDRVLKTHNAVTKGADFEEDEIISISSDLDYIENLLTELSTPKKVYDMTKKLMVEPKKDLEKRGIPSPNLADAFIMCFVPTEKPKYSDPIQSHLITI